jgi:hypothetical protein
MTLGEYIDLLKTLPADTQIRRVVHDYYEGDEAYEDVESKDVVVLAVTSVPTLLVNREA